MTTRPITLNNKTDQATLPRQQMGRGLPRYPANGALLEQAERLLALSPNRLCGDQAERQSLSFSFEDVELDMRGQRWDEQTLNALHKLAKSTRWRDELDRMIGGERINHSENRAVLHMALRHRESGLPFPEWATEAVDSSLVRMRHFAGAIQSGTYGNADGQPYTDLVLVGIGGSMLGPRLVYEALRPYWQPQLRLHFLENLDPAEFSDRVEVLNPHTTLVMVASKTFTTLETLKNAEALKRWMAAAGLDQEQLNRQFIALTAATGRAIEWGVAEEQVFPMWSWVGGRFSLWSTIGLPLMVALQPGTFEQLLEGAGLMDRHLLDADDQHNLPLHLALADLWNHNYLGAAGRAVVPYSHRLSLLKSYLQQLEMESNGKGVDEQGRSLPHHSAPLVLGGVGTPSQHAFFQLLHQGTHRIAVEILTIGAPESELGDHHAWLNANAQGQIEALMHGSAPSKEDAQSRVEGGQPVTHIRLNALTPSALGQLLALYEHKVFILACLWGINAFDQPGVELGKQLAKARIQPISFKP
ncbi:glucose-6-phosphate isomerase [Aestuariirhabdus litorea]|uniref:Glucose-6-phosphate isomerase n=1 Tax=Aestuariirhabdus litorea TaxID=2528527 RepID=A0A3P3VPW3_9GAMM|nr:glucose-6-phosphate isomerase [Aestuariirhabdus litorea]RRJ84484.1 glucose-6-phosphate isomerase [Aestuariirhabdus litorea]RWW97708.1 glucose-6-phosphate isomerase [Endozoicomonadaceae bacterium GTF-13]